MESALTLGEHLIGPIVMDDGRDKHSNPSVAVFVVAPRGEGAAVESGGGAVPLGSGALVRALSRRRQFRLPYSHRSVSTPRSSNRTCGTTAFGSQLGSRLRPRKVPGRPRKTREAALLPQPLVEETHVSPRPHLVLPAVPLS